jgi:hypothetical protein
MDFIIDLPESEGCINLIIITDYLSRGIILVPLPNIEIEIVTKAFLQFYYPYYGLPSAITSNQRL